MAARPVLPVARPGRVALIGAGPGDPELLTLKAVRAIASADVILIDDLASREVLLHARDDARVVRVGKRGGCRSTPQEFITRLMVRYARSGRQVARIKGGDPFVFGRGGEEMLALRDAGIECEVIPGVTAGLAAPAAAGIPVTHRSVSSGVCLVTAHGADGSAPDWKALAATGTTLVIYMGATRIASICAALIEAGMAHATPAAVVQEGTLPGQREVHASLATLPGLAAQAGVASPAVIVIGAVAALASVAAHRIPASVKAA